jgi:hypothetical protein
MTRIWVFGVAWLLAVLASGCATVVVPSKVELATLTAGAGRVELVDTRPPGKRIYRESDKGASEKIFGDDALKPKAFDLLSATLAESLPAIYRGMPVELTQLEVGFWIAPVTMPGSSAGQPYIPPGIPAGAAVIGALIGSAIIYGIQRAKATETAFTMVEVKIGDRLVKASQSQVIWESNGAQAALERTYRLAMEELAWLVGELDNESR